MSEKIATKKAKKAFELNKPMTMSYRFDTEWTVVKPPVSTLDRCPRCGSKHSIKAKKFGQPMNFFAPPPPAPAPAPVVKPSKKKVKVKVDDLKAHVPRPYATASYWALCPKKREPIILYDVAVSKTSYNAFLKSEFIKTLTSREDKKFLDDVKRMAVHSHSIVKMTFTPTAVWAAKWEPGAKDKAKKRG